MKRGEQVQIDWQGYEAWLLDNSQRFTLITPEMQAGQWFYHDRIDNLWAVHNAGEARIVYMPDRFIAPFPVDPEAALEPYTAAQLQRAVVNRRARQAEDGS